MFLIRSTISYNKFFFPRCISKEYIYSFEIMILKYLEQYFASIYIFTFLFYVKKELFMKSALNTKSILIRESCDFDCMY